MMSAVAVAMFPAVPVTGSSPDAGGLSASLGVGVDVVDGSVDEGGVGVCASAEVVGASVAVGMEVSGEGVGVVGDGALVSGGTVVKVLAVLVATSVVLALLVAVLFVVIAGDVDTEPLQ